MHFGKFLQKTSLFTHLCKIYKRFLHYKKDWVCIKFLCILAEIHSAVLYPLYEKSWKFFHAAHLGIHSNAQEKSIYCTSSKGGWYYGYTKSFHAYGSVKSSD